MSEEERQRLVGNADGSSSKFDDSAANNEENIEDQLLFEDVPVYTTCPNCKEKIVTRTSFKRGKYTYWTSACLCIFQCYCCVWIPFILDGLKNVVHTCPKCGEKLAEYSRLRIDRIWKKKKKHRQAAHHYSASAR
ncbi:lipopolysaccharide-induced tumor necrosis factor-alpha factor homolog [Actinia tenebrosa]|uniref:Lipopolysaccharide-induced tumor necrosis factor-alpha factor homolog n=1 Tax=Actinia tenebrosa TaxID=6105 RepID=A0A6P8I5E4_ACTTE|nr:lipopolysaccharide-induced tumor necrosis factor-alpha factor homolog [Actinia tenebrosa]